MNPGSFEICGGRCALVLTGRSSVVVMATGSCVTYCAKACASEGSDIWVQIHERLMLSNEEDLTAKKQSKVEECASGMNYKGAIRRKKQIEKYEGKVM